MTDQTDKFAFGNREVEILDDHDRTGAARIRFGQAV
jgi:hypothetical protein